MATTPPQGSAGGAPPARGQGRRVPTLYYVGGAVALVGVYYLYSRSKAQSAAASAGAAAAPVGTAAASYGNAGDLAALAPYLQTLGGPGSTAQSGSGAAYTPPTGEVLTSGGGYQQAGGATPGTAAATTPITDASGNKYLPILNQAQLSGLTNGGTQLGNVFWQPQPGVFMPVQQGMNLNGVALFSQAPSGY